ncbi:MAG: hypothetical protein OEY49_04670 [Candidatus Heimdallarchaeota archaeon]|nr:hypothetical protein [Candidatus Heimdallarchaeota archaeon]
MGLSTWTKTGSEKARSSQSIRMLMKTLQYLGEDALIDDARVRSFVNVATKVITNLFNPAQNYSVNEQVSVVFNALGWRNAQIKLTSADNAEIILGSNRYLDQDVNNVNALKLLARVFAISFGSHLLSKNVDANVEIDIHNGPIYTIKVFGFGELKTELSVESKTVEKEKVKPVQKKEQPMITMDHGISTDIDTTQIFLPILSNKLPLAKLQLLLQDIMAEYSQSWHGQNPISSSNSTELSENLITLINFLGDKGVVSDGSAVNAGAKVGSYYARAIKQSFEGEKLLVQEIIDGSVIGSMIRDIKARSFCTLKPGERCGSIGDEKRRVCDFNMGIWQGCLSNLMQDKEFKFNGFIEAGRKDLYCLMEFEVI